MKTRLGMVLATATLVAAGACASGGGGGGGGGAADPGAPAGETIAQGESPRENAQTEMAEEQLSRAADALEEGDTATAMAAYRQAADAAGQAIAADGTNPLAWRLAGRAQMGLDDYAAADSLLARAVELRPLYEFDIEPMREQAWIQLYQRAAPLVNQGQYEQAIPIFENANAIYERRPEVKVMLGQIYAQLGRGEEAIPLLQEAMDLINQASPEEYDSATLAGWQEQADQLPAVLAQAYINAERYTDAAEQLKELIAEEPGNLSYSRSLASLYIQLEKPDSAAMIYDDLLAQPDLDATTYYDVGIGLYRLEDYERAADAFQQALETAPRNRDAAEMWARSLQLAYPPARGQDTAAPPPPEGAMEELQEAAEVWIELDPYSRNAHVILAQTVNRLGDQARATELVASIEELTLDMQSLQLRPIGGGGATISGSVMNLLGEAGTPVTLEFTFYGETGQPLGTETTTVELPAQDAAQVFEVEFDSTEDVHGYTYTVQL